MRMYVNTTCTCVYIYRYDNFFDHCMDRIITHNLCQLAEVA